jgi:hypothetical protein
VEELKETDEEHHDKFDKQKIFNNNNMNFNIQEEEEDDFKSSSTF